MWSRVVRLGRSDSTSLMAANLGAALAGMLTGIVSARALGAIGRGELAVVILWPSLIATLVDFGIADAITLRTAREPGRSGQHLGIGLVLGSVASAIGIAVGVLALPVMLRSDQAYLLPEAHAALLYVPLSVAGAVPVGTLLGLRRFRAVAVVRLGTAVIYTAAMIGAVRAGHGTPHVLMWLTVLTRGTPAVLCIPYLWKDWAGATWQRPAGITTQTRDGLQLHGARIANVLAGAEDRAMASWLLPQAAIGQWQVASALTVVMPFVSQAFSQQVYSWCAAGTHGKEELIFKAYARSVLLTGIVAILAAPVLPVVIPALYGATFRPAVVPGLIVMIGAVVAAGATTLQAAARSTLATRTVIASDVAGMAVMAVTCWPGVHAWDESGLAVAYVCGRAVALGWMLASARRTLRIAGRDLLPTSRRFRGWLAEELRTIGVGSGRSS